ncbi:MAG TPA: NmrA family NAD(P)-binding protein, partial [Polyangiaceae bacterium]|nr:NmrA family NAD(P)-binding protein [Polyangiaceae bacterium]
SAGFEHTSFVEAPMYFQNLTSMMAPQALPDGGKGWAVPMDPAKKCIHMGDVGELGKLVAAAFEKPSELGNGQYASMTAETLSWNDVVTTLNGLGHNLKVVQVPNEVYDGFYPPVSHEMREMMNYWEDYSYFGPDAEKKIALANRAVPGGYTKFADWARKNMTP